MNLELNKHIIKLTNAISERCIGYTLSDISIRKEPPSVLSRSVSEGYDVMITYKEGDKIIFMELDQFGSFFVSLIKPLVEEREIRLTLSVDSIEDLNDALIETIVTHINGF
jgi:hypothetical protein